MKKYILIIILVALSYLSKSAIVDSTNMLIFSNKDTSFVLAKGFTINIVFIDNAYSNQKLTINIDTVVNGIGLLNTTIGKGSIVKNIPLTKNLFKDNKTIYIHSPLWSNKMNIFYFKISKLK